jgi:signal transduction histidine kinase
MAHVLEVIISKKAKLEFEFGEDVPPIVADAGQLRQVVINLVTNASEALGTQEGTIKLSVGVMEADREYLSSAYIDDDLAEGKYVYLEVADTGSGMNPDEQTKIFDPFFSRKFTGGGLGLAAVLGVVRGHNGTIKVDSEVGTGTTFRVLLPIPEPVPFDNI